MRTIDSVLIAAHGLNNYFVAGHKLSEYNQSQSICLDNGTTPWEDGQLLSEYMERVSIDMSLTE